MEKTLSLRNKESNLKIILDTKIIAVVRTDNPDDTRECVQAISAGGIRAIEISLTTPEATTIIQSILQDTDRNYLMGAGTVLDEATAEELISQGIDFIVAPNLNENLVRLCNQHNTVVIPGAFTPTEIVRAWKTGADLIKVFPVSSLGPRYIKDLKAPLKQIPLVPTGGVNLDNALEYLKAGASAVAVGSVLTDKKVIAEKQFDTITQTARDLVRMVTRHKSQDLNRFIL